MNFQAGIRCRRKKKAKSLIEFKSTENSSLDLNTKWRQQWNCLRLSWKKCTSVGLRLSNSRSFTDFNPIKMIFCGRLSVGNESKVLNFHTMIDCLPACPLAPSVDSTIQHSSSRWFSLTWTDNKKEFLSRPFTNWSAHISLFVWCLNF